MVLLLARLLWSERDGVMFLGAWTPSSLLPSPLSVSFPLSPLLTLPPCTHTLRDGVGIVFAILASQTARLLGYYFFNFFFWGGGCYCCYCCCFQWGGGTGRLVTDGAGELGVNLWTGVCAAGSSARLAGWSGLERGQRFPRHIHNVTKANSMMLINHASRSLLGN